LRRPTIDHELAGQAVADQFLGNVVRAVRPRDPVLKEFQTSQTETSRRYRPDRCDLVSLADTMQFLPHLDRRQSGYGRRLRSA
jgi:hypothetical protein